MKPSTKVMWTVSTMYLTAFIAGAVESEVGFVVSYFANLVGILMLLNLGQELDSFYAAYQEKE